MTLNVKVSLELQRLIKKTMLSETFDQSKALSDHAMDVVII